MRFHGIRFTVPRDPSMHIAFIIKKSNQSHILDIEDTCDALKTIIQDNMTLSMVGVKSLKLKKIFTSLFGKVAYPSHYNNLKLHDSSRGGETPLAIQQVEAANVARFIANEPTNRMYPAKVISYTKELFKKQDIKIKVFEKNDLEAKGFGLILAVGKGSSRPPALMILERMVAGSSKTICMIGKGVCFDSGGYNLKPSTSMLGMKFDKTGAAIAIAAFKHFIESDKKTSIVALVPLVENLIGGNAIKPGDIVTAWNKKTVEIANTDAEGRLIMADALAYACATYKPTLLMDFATLTGWASKQHCGASFVYYTNSGRCATKVEKAGALVGERSIRLPPWPEFARYTESEVADYSNDTQGCIGAGSMAAMFLMNFVPMHYRNKWIHFDITEKGDTKSTTQVAGIATILELLVEIPIHRRK